MRVQRHANNATIFIGMDLLVLKYYVIGLFPKIKQQAKYKRLADVMIATHIIEKKKRVWKLLEACLVEFLIDFETLENFELAKQP